VIDSHRIWAAPLKSSGQAELFTTTGVAAIQMRKESDLGGGESGEKDPAFPLKPGANTVSESGAKAARTAVGTGTKRLV
jgi:hypothetical protein